MRKSFATSKRFAIFHRIISMVVFRCLEYYEYEAKCRLEEGIAREQMQYESRLDVEHTADEVNANQTLSRSLLFPYP